eukprot:3815087-Pleurochrysis_carterae.AAC.4
MCRPGLRRPSFVRVVIGWPMVTSRSISKMCSKGQTKGSCVEVDSLMHVGRMVHGASARSHTQSILGMSIARFSDHEMAIASRIACMCRPTRSSHAYRPPCPASAYPASSRDGAAAAVARLAAARRMRGGCPVGKYRSKGRRALLLVTATLFPRTRTRRKSSGVRCSRAFALLAAGRRRGRSRWRALAARQCTCRSIRE